MRYVILPALVAVMFGAVPIAHAQYPPPGPAFGSPPGYGYAPYGPAPGAYAPYGMPGGYAPYGTSPSGYMPYRAPTYYPSPGMYTPQCSKVVSGSKREQNR